MHSIQLVVYLLMLLAERPKVLYLEQADFVVEGQAHHWWWLTSRPGWSTGQVYFRAGKFFLFTSNPTLFDGPDDAYGAAIAEKFEVVEE
jgi:hypothetical protein